MLNFEFLENSVGIVYPLHRDPRPPMYPVFPI